MYRPFFFVAESIVMATLEKRVEDLEYIVAHLPEDLNARFAGVDVKLATIREAQTLHTQRFTTLDAKVNSLAIDLGTVKSDVASLKSDVASLKSDVASLKSDVASLKSDVAVLKSEVSEIKGHLVEILSRLPRV